MKIVSRQFASLALAAVYAFIALFGHGLHTHSPCGEDGCEVAQATHACGCGHSHDPVSDHARRSTSEPSPEHDQLIAKRVADASDGCVACDVLAQLSVGYSQANPALLSQLPESRERPTVESAFASLAQRLADARGPPAARI